MPQKHRNVTRKRSLTNEERAKYAKIRGQVKEDVPELRAEGRAILARNAKAKSSDQLAHLPAIFQLLRLAREEKGLSLADVRELSGMERSAINRLENEGSPNATIGTLERLAEALNKRIVVSLEDK
jgi:DNA-binding Xre family transcriptional regulator